MSAFEIGFVAHLIRFNLRETLIDDARQKDKNDKVYSMLIAALKSSHFVLVNKTLTPTQV